MAIGHGECVCLSLSPQKKGVGKLLMRTMPGTITVCVCVCVCIYLENLPASATVTQSVCVCVTLEIGHVLHKLWVVYDSNSNFHNFQPTLAGASFCNLILLNDFILLATAGWTHCCCWEGNWINFRKICSLSHALTGFGSSPQVGLVFCKTLHGKLWQVYDAFRNITLVGVKNIPC